jgi:predicted small secreted protein
MKRTIGAAAVLAVAALVLTGCSASSGPSAGSDEVAVLETSVPLGLAPEQVCGLAQELAVEALGTSGLEEIPSGNADYAECVASSDEELVRIAVSGTSAGIEEQQNLHEALLDGSDDSLQQCPDGAEAAGVVTGLEGETSMICNGGGTSMFEYVGGAPGGVLLVRVERSTEGGNAISREQAQTWVDFAMTGLHDAAVSASGSSDGSSSPATSLAISQVVTREDGLNFTVNISLSFGAPVEDVTVAAPGQTTLCSRGRNFTVHWTTRVTGTCRSKESSSPFNSSTPLTVLYVPGSRC